MKTVIIYLFIYVVIAAGACKKDDGLTPETKEGANTFSCRINGKTFTPKASLFSGKALSAGISMEGKSLTIGAYNADTKSHIRINVFDIFKGVGTYALGKNTSNNKANTAYITYSIDDPLTREFTTELTGQGLLTITRSDSNILSGTFEFAAQSTDSPGEVVTCTQGRFDIAGSGY